MPRERKRRLVVPEALGRSIRSGFFYGVVAFSPAATTLLLTPILIASLGAEGFADWALLEPALAFGAAALTMGTQYGVLQQAAKSPEERLSPAPFCLVIALFPLLCLFLPLLSSHYSASVLIALALAQLLDALGSILTNYYRGSGRSAHMAMFEGGRQLLIAISLVGTAVLAPRGMSVSLMLWVRFLATLLLFAPLLPAVITLGLSKAALRPSSLLSYGAPIFAGQLLAITINSGDRYIATWAGVGAADLTSYVAHLRVASLVNLVVAAPLSLWYPARVLSASGPGAATDLSRKTNLLTLGAVFASLIGAELGALFLWNRVFPEIRFSPLLLAGLVAGSGFQCFAVVWNVGALQPGSTRYNMVPPAIAVGFLIPCGLFAASVSGIGGLAAGRIIANAVYAFAFNFISGRVVGTPVASRTQCAAFSAAAAALVGALLLGGSH